jgi:type I restriction enzyme M protein
VQLIDASQWYVPLRKNLGKKNCEFSDEQIQQVCDLVLQPEESVQSKIFPNEAFGYWKITVERPLRLRSQIIYAKVEELRFGKQEPELRKKLYGEWGSVLLENFAKAKPQIEQYLLEQEIELNEAQKKKLLDAATWKKDQEIYQAAKVAWEVLNDQLFDDHNQFRKRLSDILEQKKIKLGKAELKVIWEAMSWRDPDAPKVIKSQKKNGSIEYEPDADLRDTEQVPLLEEGGIQAFFEREVLPYVADAWIDESKTQIGYEISFTRYFYKPAPLRTLDAIKADIFAIEQETDGLLQEIVGVQ